MPRLDPAPHPSRPRWTTATAAVAVLAALVTATGAAASSAPISPLADSHCIVPTLVDTTFRDAAIAALERLVVRAPGRPSNGAIRAHESPGHVDPQGRAWQHVSAYAANLGMIGTLRTAPHLLPEAAAWLRWQAHHVSGQGPSRGVVADHWVRTDDLELAVCPAGLPPRSCGQVDADDSTAASTLLMADAYLRHGGQLALLREPAVRQALESAAGALVRLSTSEGLTIARPSHRVVYTMDAVEVAAGWRAWSRLRRDAYADERGAEAAAAHAQRSDSAIRTRLWDDSARAWRVSLTVGPPQAGRWYPDTVAQAWPMLWSADTVAAERSTESWRRVSARWTGRDDWTQRNVDSEGFWWPSAAVAAACVGDLASARAWIARARLRWLDPADPFAWPFQVGDLLWVLWMAEPIAPDPDPSRKTTFSQPTTKTTGASTS